MVKMRKANQVTGFERTFLIGWKGQICNSYKPRGNLGMIELA